LGHQGETGRKQDNEQQNPCSHAIFLEVCGTSRLDCGLQRTPVFAGFAHSDSWIDSQDYTCVIAKMLLKKTDDRDSRSLIARNLAMRRQGDPVN
jgi:hypothetical protein